MILRGGRKYTVAMVGMGLLAFLAAIAAPTDYAYALAGMCAAFYGAHAAQDFHPKKV